MSEYRISQEISLFEMIDEYTKRIRRVIDEQTITNVENQLAGYGYVKVIRCRDCRNLAPSPFPPWCDRYEIDVELNGFCAWAERKEG